LCGQTGCGRLTAMKFPAALLFAVGSITLSAQTQAPATSPATAPAAASQASSPAAGQAKPAAPAVPPAVKDNNIGFAYSLPAEWETLASQLATPDVPYPAVEGPKKGNACTQVELTARHGTPSSVVVVVALPFDCYGQSLTEKNLADFAAGAAEGLKQTFDVTNPVLTNYTLGSHNMWIERASGTVKGQPNAKYTLEIACTVMNKGAACWMIMAADPAHLQTFEQEAVTLEGDAFDAIVPAGAVPIPGPAPAANKPS
jgi:hypothetical protein